MLELSTIIFMIIIFGVTWGTLGFLLRKAHKRETEKSSLR